MLRVDSHNQNQNQSNQPETPEIVHQLEPFLINTKQRIWQLKEEASNNCAYER